MIRVSTRSTRRRSNETYSVSGSGLGSQVHHDHLPTLQAFQPIPAPAKGFQLPRKAAPEKGTSVIVGHLPLPSVNRPAPIDNFSDGAFCLPGLKLRCDGDTLRRPASSP